VAKTAAEAIGTEAKLDPVFARALREALFWLLAALALVLLIALASYDASDRSFSYTGEPGQVSNLIGPLGAWLASALFMLFGWPAFLFPIAIAFSAWVGLKRAGRAGPGRSTIALRVIGLVAALATSCGLATLHFPQARCRRIRRFSAALSARAFARSPAPRRDARAARSGSPASSCTPACPG
jgi:S-DNA-T family DNA segregation ATPase FtsK/SpoIIIE